MIPITIKAILMYRAELRLTKDTELADNDSIKSPEPIPELSSRSQRKREQVQKYVSSSMTAIMSVDIPY